MRSYPPNSPEAAARIVALVLIADSHVCRSEFETLSEVDAACALDMPPRAFHGIVQTLCEDLLMDGFVGGSILRYVDDGSLASLLGEVDRPQLRDQVMRIAADKHLSEGEAAVLDAIGRHWGRAGATAVIESDVASLLRS